MRRIGLTVRDDAVEEVLDVLLPLLPQGVHPTPAGDATVELAIYGPAEALPGDAALRAAAGDALVALVAEDAPADRDERRRRYSRGVVIADRLSLRSSSAPPAPAGVIDVIVDSPGGAFGTGAHPTTRMCLELLLELSPGGAFADLGCGAGALALAAARLGWSPVFAVDHEERSVEATRRNAERNGLQVEAVQADLTTVPPPPATTLAANVPPAVHLAVAAGLAPVTSTVLLSGVVESELPEVLGSYAAVGLTQLRRLGGSGWQALLLERSDG
jgi:ribosomal protein L11 methyltransferase